MKVTRGPWMWRGKVTVRGHVCACVCVCVCVCVCLSLVFSHASFSAQAAAATQCFVTSICGCVNHQNDAKTLKHFCPALITSSSDVTENMRSYLIT